MNSLTQYYIFPWILKDFNHNIFNWFSSSSYRDLSLPLYACSENLENLKISYDNQKDDKCHSGQFYSTPAFVCYFMTRQRPFTEIHLDIHDAHFDYADRLFIGTDELSNLSEKFQELIPALYNLPESYILPNWSKDDPRKFTLILKN